MKKLFLFVLLLAASGLWAQTAVGTPPLLTAIKGPGNILKVIPNAPVVVCNYPATGTGPCSNLAITYGTPSTSPTCPTNAQVTPPGTSICSATSDLEGNFGFFSLVGTYVYYFSYQGVWYGPYVIGLGGSGSAAGVSSFNTRTGNVTLQPTDIPGITQVGSGAYSISKSEAGQMYIGNCTSNTDCNQILLNANHNGSGASISIADSANDGLAFSWNQPIPVQLWAGAGPTTVGAILSLTSTDAELGVGLSTLFDVNVSGATLNVPLTVPSCTGCAASNPFAVDQIQAGTGAGTSSFFTAPQGALKYNNFSSGIQGFVQAGAADLSNGAIGSGNVVLANSPTIASATLTSPNANNITVDGTGASEEQITATSSTCDSPSAGTNFICANANELQMEFSIDGNPYATPSIPMVSTGFSTTSTASSGAALTGLASSTIRANQTVIGSCSGIYQIATGTTSASFGVSASQTPQSGFYYTLSIASNTTSGAVYNKSGTSNSTVVGTTGSVGATGTNYNWTLSFFIPWNATTAGTFTINGATGNASDALSGQAACSYQIIG